MRLKNVVSFGVEFKSILIVILSMLVTLIATVAPALSEVEGETIFHAAQSSLGKKMWIGYGLPSGKLGCSAALCNVLKKAGVTSAHSATVTVARRQLLASGMATEIVVRNGEGTEIDDAKLKKLAHPGDVLLAFMHPPSKPNGGPDAHCGIMGADANVFTNDWNDGIWKELNIHLMFDYYPYVRLLRIKPSHP